MKPGLFILALVLLILTVASWDEPAHPLMIDTSCEAKPRPNPCQQVDCNKRDISKERIA